MHSTEFTKMTTYQRLMQEAKEEFDAWDIVNRNWGTANGERKKARSGRPRLNRGKCKDCHRLAKVKGLCLNHYQQERRAARKAGFYLRAGRKKKAA